MTIVYGDTFSNSSTDNVYRVHRAMLNVTYGVGGHTAHIEPHAKPIPSIKKVLFRPPATIVFWSDNTKTVVKAEDEDEYDTEKGLAMAISKKALGNKGNYYNVFDKWLSEAPSYCSNRKQLRTSLKLEIEKLAHQANQLAKECGVSMNTVLGWIIESKKDGDNIEKTCDNCKYGDLTWYDEPCEDCCGRTMYWEPMD